MTCPNCGRYAPPDAATGYDADELCPECAREKDDCAAADAADRERDSGDIYWIDEHESDESPF
jgi:hypothetical protein